MFLRSLLKIFSVNNSIFPTVKQLWFESQRSEAKTEFKGQIQMLDRRNALHWPSPIHHSFPMEISFPYAHWVSSSVMCLSAWVSMSLWCQLSPYSVCRQVVHRMGEFEVFRLVFLFSSLIPLLNFICSTSAYYFAFPFSREDWGRPSTSYLKFRMLA